MHKALPLTFLALALGACAPSAGPQSTETTVPVGGLGAPGPCVPDYTRPDFAALERDLAAARQRWAAAGVRDYSYTFAQVAAPVRFPTVRVTVRGGAAQNVTLAAGETGEPGTQARATVEDRFADIAQKIAYQQGQPCPAVEVSYDSADGHPTRLYSGTRLAGVADGEGEWRVTGFTRP